MLLTFRIITSMQKEKVKLYYKKGSALAQSFMSETNVTEMTYTPYTLTFNGHMQAVICVVWEIILKFSYPIKYHREILTLSDGGTIALDWVLDHEGDLPRKHSSRPILCCFSGLSGGNDNLYLYSMIKEATQNGYKCVVINFRGCAGLKLTSPMIYWINTWKTDVQEPLEYIHAKYCSGLDPDYPGRNIYGYSVSLGAAMLTRYII